MCPQIDAALVNINNVAAADGGVNVQYVVIFPRQELATNFVTVMQARPAAVFAASPAPLFRNTNVVTINVGNPGACANDATAACCRDFDQGVVGAC